MALSSIICGTSDPGWQQGVVSAINNDIHVWKIRASLSPDVCTQLEKLLNKAELERASKFHQFKDRRNFIIRRSVLRILLSQYSSLHPSEITFGSTPNKKPVLEVPETNLHFNSSSSGDLILISISNSETGIDVEKNNPDFAYNEILDQCFSADETQFIKHSSNSLDAFFCLWTRKEALTKATAKGLDDDIVKIPTLNGIHYLESEVLGSGENWNVTSFWAENDYQGSIAYHADCSKLSFFEFPTADYFNR